MARIAGVDLPREKRVEIALTYIYGIGRKTANDILAATGVNPDTRVKDMTEEDEAKIREYIDIAKSEGATLLAGGGTPEGAEIQGGQFVEPTIFSDVLNALARS